MLTEDQARQKWCPAARTIVLDAKTETSHNRLIDMGEKAEGRSHCIASDCMWWRWEEGNIAVGYCGQAGKP